MLLSSTGDGTLGKCCVYRPKDSRPKAAIAEGHVTIIRVDQSKVWPEYLCDYLRTGFGAEQIHRLYTGSTGMIELTPAALDTVLINLLSGVAEQKAVSKRLRQAERSARLAQTKADGQFEAAVVEFAGATATLSVEVQQISVAKKKRATTKS